LNPELVLPGARSVIMLGVNYWPGKEGEDRGSQGAGPRWARYALHEDYHDTIKPALVAAGRALEELMGWMETAIATMLTRARCWNGAGRKGRASGFSGKTAC